MIGLISSDSNYRNKRKFGAVKLFFIAIAFVIFGSSQIFAANNECTTEAPTSPCIIYSTTNKTNQNVTAILTGIGSDKVTNNNRSNIYEFTGNGSFTFKYGSRGKIDATVDWIDQLAPVCGYSQNIAGQDYFAGCNENDYKECTNNNGWTDWITRLLYNRLGYQSECLKKCAENNHIDYNGELVDEDVTVTLTGCSENVTITNNNGSNTYVFTENGTFIFYYEDEAGNEGHTEVPMNSIREKGLTCQKQYSTENWTNQNVVVSLTGCNFSGDSTNQSYTFTGIGEHTFQLTDNSGGVGSVSAKVTWIDKTAPTCNLLYSTTQPTSGSVIAKLTGCSEQLYNSQTIHLIKNNGVYTFEFYDRAGNTGYATDTVNWIEEIKFITGVQHELSGSTIKLIWDTLSNDILDVDIFVRDSNYNTYQELGTVDIQTKEFSFESLRDGGHLIKLEPEIGGESITYFVGINGEDKPIITPKCEIKYDIESDTNNDVTAELTNCNEPINVTNNGRSLLHIFTENDNFTFEFEDDYGNTGEATASVSWIDKMAPSCTVEYSTQEETTSNVIAMLTGCSETVYLLTGDNSYTFAENGSYPFIFFDNAGNRGIAMANVNRIKSEENPTTILTGISHIVLDGQITLFWTKLIDDSTQISYKHNSGDYENLTTINSSNEFYSFESEGEGDYEIKFEFKGYDDILYTFTIDPEPDPTCTISYSTTDWINGSVVATLSCNRDVNIVGNSGNNKITFENNGSYTFRYTYGDGKIGEKTATVTRIDKKAPICGLWTYNKKTITNNDVIVTLSRSSDDGAGINMSGGTCIITGNNKSCTIEISDLAGNTGICSSQMVTWIDKDAPVLSEVIAVPSYISGHTPSYTFSSNETGIINYYGGCSGDKTNAISGENTITFHKLPNGIYDTCKITITDAAGNTGELNITPFKINDKSPVCDIEYSTKDWTSGDVIANLVRCTEGATGFNETGYTFTGNGEFIFTFVSEAGIEGSTTATVSKIDKTGPSCIRGDPSKTILKGEDTGEITLTCIDTGAGIKNGELVINNEYNEYYTISLTNSIINGNENIYIFEYTAKNGINGEAIFTLPENAIIDNVGNDATFNNKSLIVDNAAPTCVISGINDNRVNHEILLEIMMYDTNVDNSGYSRDGIGYSNIKTKTAYENGIYTGYVKDLAGNEGHCTGEVNKIDKIKPICGTRSYSTQETTSGTIIATLLNSIDTGAGISISGGNCTISENNQSCNIEISDNAGNTEICTSETVTRIDKQAPNLVEIIPVPEVTANTKPEYTFYTDEAGEIAYSGDCTGNVDYANTGNNKIRFNELSTGTHNNCSIIVTDLVGNISEALQISTFEINTKAPTCNVEYDSSRTGGTVEVILTGCSEGVTGFNETGYEFTENGSFTFSFRNETTDVSGYVTVNINNIDKEPPLCGNWSYNPVSGSWTNGTVTGFLRNSYDTGAGISQAEWSCEITNSNQSCNVVISDNVGNTGTCLSDEVRWIDNDAPILAGTEITTPTSNHYIEYSFNSSEAGELQYFGNCSSNTKYANNGDNTIIFDYLGDGEYDNCKITVTDIAGNQSDQLIIPTFKIDSATPTCNIEYSTIERTSGTVEAILTGCTIGTTGFNETGHTFTKNDIFEFTFISETGIPGHANAIVGNIDTTKPICGIWSYTPTLGIWTSGSVIATLSNSTDNLAGIKISGGNCEITGNNTTCSIEISDMVGNSKTCISDSIRWIDNTKPKISEIVPINTPSAKKTPELYLRSDKSGTLLYSGVCEPQDTEVNIGNNSITLKELNDGTYDNCEFAVVDYLGNQSDYIKISTFQINTQKPKCNNIIYSTTGPTNQNITATLTGCDTNIVWFEEKEHIFNENGTFTFLFRNSFGITGSAIAKVENIDKITPTCDINFNPNSSTSGTVTAKLTGCSEDIKENNISHVFNENGVYTFIFHDLAGNTGSKLANVDWIKTQQEYPDTPHQDQKIVPNCSVDYSTTEATIGHVIATVTGCNIEITGTELQYTFTGNGIHVFTFSSLSGVSGIVTGIVDWIIQSHGSATSGEFGCNIDFETYDGKFIKSTLTGCNSGTTVINNNGNFYHILDNTETLFDYIVKDSNGNIGLYPIKRWFFEDFSTKEENESGDHWYVRSNSSNTDKYLILEGEKNKTKYYTISGINLSGNNSTIFESDIYCDLPNWDYFFVEISTGGNFSEIGNSITNTYNNVFNFELGDEYSLDNISIRFSLQSNNDDLEGYCKIDNVLLTNKPKLNIGEVKPTNKKDGYTTYKLNIKGLQKGEIVPISLIYNNIAENYKNCINSSNVQKLGSGDIILYKNGDDVTKFSTFAQNGDQFTVKVKSLYQYFGSNSIDIVLGKHQKSSIYNIPILQKDIYNNILYDEDRYEAYEYAYCYGITNKGSISQANMVGNITRVELAKMISNYAINVLGKVPNTTKYIKFSDVSNNMDSQYDDGVTKAYQLGLMGQNMPNNKFRPYDYVTRAEFATTLSRLLYNTPDGTKNYYFTHINKLKNEGVISTTDPKLIEKRGYVMLMLMRTYQN